MGIRASAVARALFALTALAFALTLVLGAINTGEEIPDHEGDLVFTLIFGGALLGMGLVGTLVAVRRPENPVGWILLGSSAVMTLSGAGQEYAVFALVRGSTLPGAAAGAWLTEWVFVPALFVMPALLLLLFPDGRPASPRWRPALLVVVGGATLFVLGSLLRPATLEDEPFTEIENPSAVAGLGTVAEAAYNVGLSAMALGVVLGTVSMVLRLRRSHGVERAQLKWIAAGAALFALACVVGVGIVVATGSLLGAVFVVLSFPLLPTTAGVVILRHRLYDVDVVIRRTLIYAVVTATLVAAYVALVLALGAVFRPLAGGSDLVVAVSTLTVAALFGPVRRRAQVVVDRRFFRRRYDAQRTLDQFGSHLRVTTDLGAVGDQLLDVVHETVQPTHLSLWVRDR